MNVVTIHQPEHLSYLGFFHKVSMADTLVLLDNVQYEKNYFQSRNRIYTSQGVRFVTVPVTNANGPINKVRICDNFFDHICRKNVRTIEQAYGKAPFFKKYGEEFLSLYSSPNSSSLSTYNENLLKYILRVLEIDVRVIKASMLGVKGAKTDLLLDICHKADADKYVSGASGRDYLEREKFDIPVEFQKFAHPTYTQWGKTEFQPYLSIIDALFNIGPNIMQIIKAAN
jgi:hypothetical protein